MSTWLPILVAISRWAASALDSKEAESRSQPRKRDKVTDEIIDAEVVAESTEPAPEPAPEPVVEAKPVEEAKPKAEKPPAEPKPPHIMTKRQQVAAMKKERAAMVEWFAAEQKGARPETPVHDYLAIEELKKRQKEGAEA